MRGITLFIFGGVAEMSVEPPGAKAEFLTAVIGPDADALSVLGRMNETGNSRLLVVDNGRLAGIVTLKDLMEVLALRMEIEGPRH